MYKIGQQVILNWDDAEDNQSIIGKVLTVLKLHNDNAP